MMKAMTRTCSAQRQAELERAQSVLVAAQAMAREVQIRIHDTHKRTQEARARPIHAQELSARLQARLHAARTSRYAPRSGELIAE